MFNIVVGNPPYQQGRVQVYANFYLLSIDIGNIVCLVFPSAWQSVKSTNGLLCMNNEGIKYDRQLICIDNRMGVFNGICDMWVSVVLWGRGYDNGLLGKQVVYTEGVNSEVKLLDINDGHIVKPIELVELESSVKMLGYFISLIGDTSARDVYRFRADVFDRPMYYGLGTNMFKSHKDMEHDIKIVGLYKRSRVCRFISRLDINVSMDSVDVYKVFIPKAWGSMRGGWLGGVYSSIIVASPNVICTESFIVQGHYYDIGTCYKHAKYIMTRFVRGLLHLHKHTHNMRLGVWDSIPRQDFSEVWWDESIEQIEVRLFDKYNVSDEVRAFVLSNIQPKTEQDIEFV